VKLRELAVRLCGDDGRGFHLLAVGSHPGLPQAGEADRNAILRTDAKRALAAGRVLPFVETVRGEEAPPPSHGIAERGLVIDRLGARVDEQAEAAGILHPGWDQAPTHQRKLSLALPHAHDGHRLRGGHIVARGEIRLLRIAEQPAERLRRGEEQITSAHARAFG
jgi:hypothetical protein